MARTTRHCRVRQGQVRREMSKEQLPGLGLRPPLLQILDDAPITAFNEGARLRQEFLCVLAMGTRPMPGKQVFQGLPFQKLNGRQIGVDRIVGGPEGNSPGRRRVTAGREGCPSP